MQTESISKFRWYLKLGCLQVHRGIGSSPILCRIGRPKLPAKGAWSLSKLAKHSSGCPTTEHWIFNLRVRLLGHEIKALSSLLRVLPLGSKWVGNGWTNSVHRDKYFIPAVLWEPEEEAGGSDEAAADGNPTLKTRSSPDKKLKSPNMVPNPSLGLVELSWFVCLVLDQCRKLTPREPKIMQVNNVHPSIQAKGQGS